MTSTPRTRTALLATSALAILATIFTGPVPVALAGPGTAATSAADPSDPPNPPSDIVGRSTSSAVLRSDELMIGPNGSDGMTSANWNEVKPDLSTISGRGSENATASRTALPSTVTTTRSARLMDPNSDRLLSLTRTKAGDQALWQLSSPNGAMETTWQAANDDDPTQGTAGQTFSFIRDKDGSGLAGATDSGDAHEQLQVAPGNPNTMVQQWTLRSVPDAGFRTFRLVNRSDGTCLNVLDGKTDEGSPVGAWPCPDSSASDNEEWTIRQVDNPQNTAHTSFALQNRRSGRYLTVSSSGGLELGSTDQSSYDEVWLMTGIHDPVTPVPTWSTWASTEPGMPAAMATGDLDRSVGVNSHNSDEGAVAYVDDNHQLQVRVLDYNATADHFLATSPDKDLPTVGTTIGKTWYPGSVGVAIGNFTGEVLDPSTDTYHRDNQLAVTWQDAKGMHVTFLSYTATGSDRQLTVLDSDVALPRATGSSSLLTTSGLADTAVGDFNGDDVDDLAIGYGAATPAPFTAALPFLKVLTFDQNLAVTANTDTDISDPADNVQLTLPAAGQTWTRRGIKIVPGLFSADDSTDRDIRRRQLAAAWTMSPLAEDGGAAQAGNTYTRILAVNDDATKVSSAPSLQVLGQTTGDDLANQPLALTAGGFGGRGTGKSIPTWGLAVGSSGSLRLVQPQSTSSLKTTYSLDNWGSDAVDVAAYDRDGNSLILGPPAILTVDQLDKPTLIAAQPPAHLDWLNNQFVNVSRTGEFTVTLGTDKSIATSSTHSTDSATSVGVSKAADSKTSVRAGLGGVDSVEGGLEISDKLDTESTKDQQNTQSYGRSTDISTEQTTDDDDIVNAAVVSYTIYRYPILGGPLTTTAGQAATSSTWCPTACHGFYEVTVPGKVSKISGGGADDPWYQPDWQNGNALSYPTMVNNQVAIKDLGSYSYPNPTQGGKPTTRTDAMFNDETTVDNDSTNKSMKIDDDAAEGSTRTSSSSMTNSKEVKASLKVHVKVGVAEASEDTTLSAGQQNGSTWSDTTTGTTDTTSSNTFTLDVPRIDPGEAYKTATAYYVDSAGTPKVVHAVDLTASATGAEFWQRNYSRPDLALNLNQVSMLYNSSSKKFDLPKWRWEDNRQRIRGFSTLQPTDPTSPLTSGQPYAENPEPGDNVTFAVQVHNYSLSQAPQSSATFYAVPMDSTTLNRTGDPVLIGSSTIPSISAQGITTINSPTWTAQGPPDGDGSQNWRIFVVLDPNATIDEVHPWQGQTCPSSSIDDDEGPVAALTDPLTGKTETLACGQNNQGYGEVTVTTTSSFNDTGSAADSTKDLTTADAKKTTGGKVDTEDAARADTAGFGGPAITREDERNLTLTGTTFLNSHKRPVRTVGRMPQLVVDRTAYGLIHATSTVHSPEAQHILVYDGPPSKGKLIAHTKMAGADADTGGTANFSWRPTATGRHTLYEVLLTSDGPDKIHTTEVMVQAHGPAVRLDLSPATSTTQAGKAVRYIAVTVDRTGRRVADASARTVLRISPEGSCRGTTCTATKPGRHVVTATYGGFKASATLTVTPKKRTVSLSPPAGRHRRR